MENKASLSHELTTSTNSSSYRKKMWGRVCAECPWCVVGAPGASLEWAVLAPAPRGCAPRGCASVRVFWQHPRGWIRLWYHLAFGQKFLPRWDLKTSKALPGPSSHPTDEAVTNSKAREQGRCPNLADYESSDHPPGCTRSTSKYLVNSSQSIR